MSIQVLWFPAREEEFISLGGLEGLDAEIIRLRHHRYGRVKDVAILNERGFPCTEDLYDRRIEFLKRLYDEVQLYSDRLPKREKTKRDTYLSREKITEI